MNILAAMDDAAIFALWFQRGEWQAWRAFIAALFGLPMDADQLALYRQCTAREDAPDGPANEAWLVCGRRAGKSFILALIAVFLACFRDYRACLAPGERATILIIATDRKQARVIVRYVRAMLTGIPMLARTVERETAESFDLANQVTIEVATASFKKVRGYSVAAALCDELAFWPSDEAAEPDYAILDALRPAMATIPGAMLLCASSPHARRGALWDAHRRYYGKPGPILVWQAATRTMNPSVPQRVIDEAMERDPAVCAAEFLANFRTDVERVFTREAIDACVSPSIYERAPVAGVSYFAFVDPSGGSADSMTLAIAHREGDAVVLDAARERKPPFSPEAVVKDFAALLKSYRVGTVRGDRYAGEWPREQFRKAGISYVVADQAKSDLYRDLLPAINSGLVDLLDHDRLIAQLVGLERRTGRGGRDSIDHAPGGHDDVANAVAGCVAAVMKHRISTDAGIAGPMVFTYDTDFSSMGENYV
jgi:hypothetical protein